jgi:pentachlorophenol monooxygenase/3-(3-hydroxy-phenyl)propionate hydroxylase
MAPLVAVVGNGPVGQTAALMLARWGLPVVLLDQRPYRDPAGSKSIVQQRDVLDVWDAVGAGRRIADEGVTWATARTFYRDGELFSLTFADARQSRFPPFVNISQSRTEQILDECIAGQPLISVRWGHRVTGLAQDAGGVSLTCAAGGGRVLRADYVMACAGARGDEVRRMLGVNFGGYSFGDRFLICDIRTDLPGWATERRFYFDPPWNPGRQVLIHPCPDSTFRIDWQVPADFDESEEARDARIRAIIGDRPYELVWSSVYRFSSRVADRMRVGRVLLAGDMAHLFAPFGARGLNSGVQDAENAAWKIAFVLRGWAAGDLLDSYHAERHAAARENLEVTSATMRFLVPATDAERRHRLTTLDSAAADPAARAAVDSGRLAEPFWYSQSPLTTPDPGRPFAGRPARGAVPPPGPGILVPDVPFLPAERGWRDHPPCPRPGGFRGAVRLRRGRGSRPRGRVGGGGAGARGGRRGPARRRAAHRGRPGPTRRGVGDPPRRARRRRVAPPGPGGDRRGPEPRARHDPGRHRMTWLDLPPGTGFGLANLPFGVFSAAAMRPGTTADGAPPPSPALPAGRGRRVGVAIGDRVLDAAAVADDLRLPLRDLFAEPALNRFLAAGPATWREARERLTEWLTRTANETVVRPHLVPLGEVRLHLPIAVADYVDFYASRRHAENVGAILRPGQPPLPRNWLHMPLGYQGRAGSVVISGTPVTRPCGQRMEPGDPEPAFGPSRRLDFEAEVGFVAGVPSTQGEPVPLARFAEHVFGACLVNDWSARDIQAFETVPLGPFLGKAFATSISPWVVPLDALRAARVPPPPRDPPPPPYLRDDADPWGLDLSLTVTLNEGEISRPPFATMYWTPAQMLAHLTSGGAPLRTGDLYASGTVSGPGPGQLGCLLELTRNGAEPIALPDGTQRTFLEDNDEVVIAATAPSPDGNLISFGEVRGRVVARPA